MHKFKIGEKFIHTMIQGLKFTVIAVSPNIDYEGNLYYFVEFEDTTCRKWYVAVSEIYVNDLGKKIN